MGPHTTAQPSSAGATLGGGRIDNAVNIRQVFNGYIILLHGVDYTRSEYVFSDIESALAFIRGKYSDNLNG